MPASLDKLPEELLKLILDHVDAADKSWSERGPELDEDGADMVAAGKSRWSAWYGRGVFALAHVDKRWNALARSILFRSIQWSAFASSFFQLYILGEPLGHCVKEVDLRFDGSEDPPGIAWACALLKLPELAAIRTDIAVDEVSCDVDTSPEDEDLARSSGVKAMGRISTLDLSGVSLKNAVSNLKLVDPVRLHTLKLWFQDVGDLLPLYDMPGLLQHLVALHDLELDMVLVVGSDDENDDDSARVTLPSLKTLKLCDVALEDSLRFAAACTPNITTLTVEYDPSLFSDPVGPPFVPTPSTLPKLRRLVVSGSAVFHTHIFGVLPPLVEQLHVKLCPASARCVRIVIDDKPKLTSDLRELVLDIPSSALIARHTVDSLERLCWHNGIRFNLHRRYTASAPSSRRVDPALWPNWAQAMEVEKTLAWATARAQWLHRMPDPQALEEMATLTAGLKERRAIERS